MANVATVTIIGAKETIAKLDALDKKVRRKVVSAAMRAGAKVIVARAKANAPVASGKLKKAINVRVAKFIGSRKKKRGEIAINAQIGKGNFKGKTFYGAFQEFGWKSGRRVKKGKTDNRRQIQGKHFMETAGKQGASEAVNVIMNTIRTGIEEAAK